MPINPIKIIHEGTQALGKSLAVPNAKACKINKSIEANGISLATGAFVTIVGTCVLIPRLITARDADERREIFTRDFVTVLTMLFAMKGLKGGLSNFVSKKKGLVLTSVEKPLEKMNPVQKFIEYFKPIGGVNALSSRQLASKYTNISDKKTLINFMKYIDENGGNIKQALSVDKNNGKKLISASENVLGKDFEKLDGKGLIALASSKTEAELKPILDVLSEKKNPLVVSAKRINAWLEAMSLGIVVSFLGFGLPEINRRVTNYKYDKLEDDRFELSGEEEKVQRSAGQEVIAQVTNPQGRQIKLTKSELEVFKNFM